MGSLYYYFEFWDEFVSEILWLGIEKSWDYVVVVVGCFLLLVFLFDWLVAVIWVYIKVIVGFSVYVLV